MGLEWMFVDINKIQAILMNYAGLLNDEQGSTTFG
jgi:hypothetical protein